MDHLPSSIPSPTWMASASCLDNSSSSATIQYRQYQETYMEQFLRLKSDTPQVNATNIHTLPAHLAPHPAPSVPHLGYNMQSSSHAPPPPFASINGSNHIAQATDLTSGQTTSISSSSRFQQLLMLKRAAEKKSASSVGITTMASPPLKLTEAYANFQGTDTVMHKDFASRYYAQASSSGSTYPQTAKHTKHQHPTPASVPAGQSDFANNKHRRVNSLQGPSDPALNVTPDTAPNALVNHKPTVTSSTVQLSVAYPYDGEQLFVDTASAAQRIGGMYAPQPEAFESYNVSGQPSMNEWSTSYMPTYTQDARAPKQVNVSSYDAASYGQSTVPSSSSSAQYDSSWQPKDEGYAPPSGGWSTPVSYSASMTYNYRPERVASSFSWNVSSVRTPDVEASYLPPSFDHTPALSIRAEGSIGIPSPVTPVGHVQRKRESQIPAAYVTVKIEQDLPLQHLALPYETSQVQRGDMSALPLRHPIVPINMTESPLFGYGVNAFANMNGAIQLSSGGGMYVAASVNGGGDIPSTLANGLAGGSGGEGSSGGSNGSGGGWPNGNGNGHGNGGGGEASGSGRGNGDRDGSGSNDGQGDGGDADDGTPRSKKLALACHFCRRRKLKCDGIRPTCDNCSKRNEECSWDDNVRRRGPGKATKERREKAAREAVAAGLTNSNSLGTAPDLDPSIITPPLPDLTSESTAQFHDMGLSDTHIDPDIPIDPALAALNAAIPGTLAELEVKKGIKRKSDGGHEEVEADDLKRFRLEGEEDTTQHALL